MAQRSELHICRELYCIYCNLKCAVLLILGGRLLGKYCCVKSFYANIMFDFKIKFYINFGHFLALDNFRVNRTGKMEASKCKYKINRSFLVKPVMMRIHLRRLQLAILFIG